jgi:excisionase family DNA binding protein
MSEAHTNSPDMGGYAFASAVTAIPVPTLYALVHQRRIPHNRLSRRMVRFKRAELERWLAERAVPTAARTET